LHRAEVVDEEEDAVEALLAILPVAEKRHILHYGADVLVMEEALLADARPQRGYLLRVRLEEQPEPVLVAAEQLLQVLTDLEAAIHQREVPII